jgi:hypothetical protein
MVVYILIFTFSGRREDKKNSELNGNKHSPNLNAFKFFVIIYICYCSSPIS